MEEKKEEEEEEEKVVAGRLWKERRGRTVRGWGIGVKG